MKFFTFLLFIFLAYGSIDAYSQSKIRKPVEFDKAMTDIMTTLSLKGNYWSQKFMQLDTTTRDFSQLSSLRMDIEQYLNKEILELKTMDDVKNSQNYRQAMLDFLEFEKNLVTTGYAPIEKLTHISTRDDIRKALDELTVGAKKEGTEADKIKTEQKAYAERNNFKVEDPASTKN